MCARSPFRLLLLLFLVVSGCGQASAPQDTGPAREDERTWPVVRLGYQRTDVYRHFFLAEERGFFRQERVRVEGVEFPSANVMGQALVAGRIDGTAINAFPVIFAMEQNAPGQSVCYLVNKVTRQAHPDALLVPRNSSITRIEELRGKRIATYPGSTLRTYTRLILQRALGSADAATITQVEPGNQLQLLESGQIDATLTLDPIAATAVARGIARVLEPAPLARYVMDPLPGSCSTFSPQFVERNRAAVDRVRRAMERAVDFMRDPAHRGEVRRVLVRRAGIDAAVAERLGDLEYWKLSEIDRDAVQRLADLLQREGALERRVETRSLFLRP